VFVHLSACFLSETWGMDFNKIGIGGAYTKICQADLIVIVQLQHNKE